MANDFKQFLCDSEKSIAERAGEWASEHEMLCAVLNLVMQLNHNLNHLRKQVQIMSETTVTRVQLDAAIAQLLQAEAARDQAVLTALSDLQAKVAGGTVTPEDFSAELASIATLATNASQLTQTATADDPGPTTVPSTPIVDPRPADPAPADTDASTQAAS